jgi:hypothetical protein
MVGKIFNKFPLICFMILVFFQSSCAAISKNREIDSKNSAISKSKHGEVKKNKKVRKTLSGHGKEAGDSFMKTK